jgi:hypothetical protein
MNKRALTGILLLAAAVLVVVVLRILSSEQPSPQPAQESPQAPASQAAPVPVESSGRPAATTHEKLQRRLDALAQAYNDGNRKAIELALWDNHAVVRPNGEHLDRAGVLEQWEREWTQFSNRNLSFAVIEVTEDGGRVSASWSLKLTADLQDEAGQSHAFELTGVQAARYTVSGDTELLDGPITYTSVRQTLDGEPFGASQ